MFKKLDHFLRTHVVPGPKNIKISYSIAYFTASVHSGSVVAKKGQAHKTSGFEISADHRRLTAQSYPGNGGIMICIVCLKNGERKEVLEKTVFALANVRSVEFNNGRDDSCYSFTGISDQDLPA